MAASSLISSSSSSPRLLSPGEAERTGKALASALNIEEGLGGFLNCRTPLIELFRTKMIYQLHVRSQIDPFFFPGLVDVFTSKSSLTTPSLSALFSKFANSSQYRQMAKPDQLGSRASTSGQTMIITSCFARIFANAIKSRDLTDLTKFVEQMQRDQEEMESAHAEFARELGSFSPESMVNQFSSQLEISKQLSERGVIDLKAPQCARTTGWIRHGATLMKNNELALLERTPLDLEIHAQPVLPTHRYRMGVRYFIQAIQEVNQLRLLHNTDQLLLPSHLKSPVDVAYFLIPQFHLFRDSLKGASSLSPSVNRSIDFSVLRSVFRLRKADEDLDLMTLRFLSLNSMKYYTSVLHSREAQIISSYLVFGSNEGAPIMASELLPPDAPSVYPAFATEHRDVFENFAHRFLSLTDYFSTVGKQAQSDLKVLREMPLFLKFGDMDRLSKRIQKAKGNPQKIDRVIAQEIDKFLVEKNTPTKLREILTFLRGEGTQIADPKRATSFQALERKWTAFPETVELLLRNKTLRAQNALADLFIDSPETSSKRTSRKLPKRHTTTSSSS